MINSNVYYRSDSVLACLFFVQICVCHTIVLLGSARFKLSFQNRYIQIAGLYTYFFACCLVLKDKKKLTVSSNAIYRILSYTRRKAKSAGSFKIFCVLKNGVMQFHLVSEQIMYCVKNDCRQIKCQICGFKHF